VSASPELNRQQLQAVLAQEPLIVVAGPGTGKTRTLAFRVAHLIRERQVPGHHILAVTFTRSAAREMRERLKLILSGSPAESLGELWVDTFHSVALRILREQSYPFGPGNAFSVANDEEKQELLEGLLPRRERPGFLEELRRRKQRLEPPSGLGEEYQRRLLAARRLDFEDLLLHACRLFEERPEVLESYRSRLRHILVDEFQDTSLAQYLFLSRLESGNLCVIGDPDQAIYGFAGAFDPFARFKTDHPGHRVVTLCENYRSRAGILEAAKQVIAKNSPRLPRELQARLEQGLPVEINAHQSDRQEAEMIVRRIEALLGGSSLFSIDSRWAEKESESYAYGLEEIAVLYRFHAQALRIQEALERSGLPFRCFGKKPKADGRVSPDEDLEDFQTSEEAAPSPLLPRGAGVTLMTLHRSKGLEFPVVFLAGCEDGVLPARLPEQPQEALEQERRLFYVGMTRAKSRLFLSYAKKRFLWGRTREAGPSPFIRDIEEELRILKESQVPRKRRAPQSQPTLFELP